VNGFTALLRKEMREQWRTYRLLSVAAVLLVFGLISPALARYTPELLKAIPDLPPDAAALIPPPTVADALGQYLKNLTQFGVLLALLISMGAIAYERERGTAAMTLSKPVALGAFLGAKFAALTLTFTVALVLAGLGCYVYTGLLFEWLAPWGFVALNLLLLVYLLVFVALAFFASAVARTQLAAAGIGFALFIVFWLAAVIPQFEPNLPGALLGWGVRAALGTPGAAAWTALGVSLALIAACVLGAWAVLRRQEI
jgi:ABC-2 type transport system permease protein